MALQELEFSSEVEECIDNCFEASQAAERCAQHCIEQGEAERSRCIQLCRDAAEITALHARMMARESEYHNEMAAICADLCETCADECGSFEGQIMQTCEQACRKAAETCRQMAGA